jgi:ribose transport system permease protein
MAAMTDKPAAPLPRTSMLRRVTTDPSLRTVGVVYFVATAMVACTRFVNPSAGSVGYIKTVLALSTFTAVVAFGQGIVVLTGGFDLSIPNTMTLAAVILTAEANGSNAKAGYVIPLIMLLGAAIGFFNGVVTMLLRVSPIVVTLGVNTILSGVVLVYTNGKPSGNAPPIVVRTAVGGFFGRGLPALIVVLLVFLVLGTLLLNGTTFGRRIYAVGGDAIVAKLSGISTSRVIVSAYVLSGVTAAIGGMLLAGFSGQSFIGMGDPYLLTSLAAVLVGGAAVTGGKGYYAGTVGGAIILVAISTMLAGTKLPDSVQDIVYAAAILVAVTLARASRRETA